jgi:ABC-type glycerol-3-phosphate transport system permease component
MVARLWVAFLLAILAFLVIYPVLTLLLGALTDTNPVVDGLNLKHLSIANFLSVLANPNVAEALGSFGKLITSPRQVPIVHRSAAHRRRTRPWS